MFEILIRHSSRQIICRFNLHGGTKWIQNFFIPFNWWGTFFQPIFKKIFSLSKFSIFFFFMRHRQDFFFKEFSARFKLTNYFNKYFFVRFSDSLLNFPNLTVFKQEIPSPPNQNNDLLRTPRNPNMAQFRNMSPTTSCIRITQHMAGQTSGMVNESSPSGQNINDPQQGANGSTSSSNGLSNFLEQLGGGNNHGDTGNTDGQENIRSSHRGDESRFQYVLAAATSIATKSNEETMTYLNQGQSYEIKVKKLGDLSTCRGKVMKSVIKICFHERRLQYMEREQMQIWQSSRPGERILGKTYKFS